MSELNSTVGIIKLSSNIIACSSRALEFLVVVFLTSQYLKTQSNYKSAYFVILNVGYIADLTILLNWVLPLSTEIYNFSMILHTWHNTYFVTAWNAILCFNRCTALAFAGKHDKVGSHAASSVVCLHTFAARSPTRAHHSPRGPEIAFASPARVCKRSLASPQVN